MVPSLGQREGFHQVKLIACSILFTYFANRRTDRQTDTNAKYKKLGPDKSTILFEIKSR